MVDYLHQLAEASDRVQIFEFGETYERRKMYLLAISSKENMTRLEDIRTTIARLKDPRLTSPAEAETIAAVQKARVDSERERIEIYRELDSKVMLGLAAREFAGKLRRIDHLNLGHDALAPMLGDLLRAGAGYLGNGSGAAAQN